jgi:hypothetical protein
MNIGLLPVIFLPVSSFTCTDLHGAIYTHLLCFDATLYVKISPVATGVSNYLPWVVNHQGVSFYPTAGH